MTSTVQPATGTPVAETTDRPSRLQVVVALAVLCRDDGMVDWPKKLLFSDEYPEQLQLYTSTVEQMWALANAIGARVEPTTRTTGEGGAFAHHHARGRWLSYRVSITCLEPIPDASAAPDAETSAAIDDLAATVVTQPEPPAVSSTLNPDSRSVGNEVKTSWGAGSAHLRRETDFGTLVGPEPQRGETITVLTPAQTMDAVEAARTAAHRRHRDPMKCPQCRQMFDGHGDGAA